MAVATRSLLQIIHGVADDLGLRTTGVLTAASTTALTCASYPYKTNRTNADDSLYVGSEIYITSGTEPSPNPNGVGAYAPSTGIFTPSFTYTVAPDSDATFDLYLRDVSITEIRAAVNEALRKRYYKVLWPLTIVPDGDMASSSTGSWTGSNATLSKVTSSGNQVNGNRSLRVLATADGGYARTSTINVNPDDLRSYYVEAAVRAEIGTAKVNPDDLRSYYVEAAVRAEIGTAKLSVYDVTNATEIASDTYDLTGWGVISLILDLPDTCEQIQVRLTSVTNADDTYWNYLMVLPMGVSAVNLPDFIDRPGQVQMLYRGSTTEPGVPGMALTKAVMWFRMVENRGVNSAYRLEFAPRATGPMWAVVYKPYDQLTLDTDTTTINRDWIEAAAAVELLGRLTKRPPSTNTDDWKRQYMTALPKLKRLDVTWMPRELRIQMPEPY